MIEVVVWAHAVSTVAMAGLIWFVQVVHYPLMAHVGRELFVTYEVEHARRTSRVVVAPMLLELASAVVLVVAVPPGVASGLAVVGLALVGAVWLSTFTLQVPAHRRLALGFDALTHLRLVRSNWIRTVAWSGRVPIAVALLAA